ncbi:MAG: glycosyltransferase family 4 protein [Acidimicrobiia bacterium]|nr:glycosyltransferase family 4 protein [Acidimicrobiia bacterium]
MLIGVDATALHGARTGVGVMTHEILSALAARTDVDVAAYAVTWRGRGQLGQLVPPGVRTIGRPMAAQPLRQSWLRSDVPPIEWLVGSLDVVHGPNFVVPPARRAAEVATVHDLTPWRFPELANRDTRQYPQLVARAVRRGAWIHAVSEWVAGEVAAEHPAAADRIVVVPNGVTPLPPETRDSDAARGRELAGAARYLVAVGTVEPRKDLPGLVRAFDEVVEDDGDDPVRLVLAGPDGWGAEALTDAIRDARHRDRIRRLGWVSDDERAALLRGATAFAYPSRYEGFGLPPLEAMLAGVPVVTTTAGALQEVVGDAALLVPPLDHDALVAGLIEILRDDMRRASLVAAGTARAARYDWARTADGLVDLYRRATA